MRSAAESAESSSSPTRGTRAQVGPLLEQADSAADLIRLLSS